MFFSKFLKKRGQASFEYIIVFSLGFVILLPTIYLFYSFALESGDQITSNDIAIIGNDIINAAESAFYMGKDTRLTIEETFPDGIKNITLHQDWDNNFNQIVFNLEDGSSMVYFSEVNINGTFQKEDYSAGLKRIRVESTNNSNYDFVWIDIY